MDALPPNAFRFGGGTTTLRSKKEVKVSFAKKQMGSEANAELWKVSVADRMRHLDDLHKHAPLSEECVELNIPDDRLDLHSTRDILFLCGGCAGVRFSSEDFTTMSRSVSLLIPIWAQLESQFKTMDNASKKRVLKGGPYALSSSSSSSSSSSTITTTATTDTSEPTTTATTTTTTTAAAAAEEEVKDNKVPVEDNFPNVILFHQTADSYTSAMHTLQLLMRTKLEAIETSTSSTSGAREGRGEQHLNSLPCVTFSCQIYIQSLTLTACLI